MTSLKHLFARLPRRYHARVLSSFLCAILVVIKPFSRLGGSYAFLTLTIHELVFSPQSTLAQTFECIVLHTIGGFFGIAFSTLAHYISALFPLDSIASRSTLAVSLAIISFVGGYLKSRLPRLVLAVRIMLFISIWMLTLRIDQQKSSESGKHWLWIILTAALTSLLSSMVVLRWSSPQMAVDIASSFGALYTILDHAVNYALHDPAKTNGLTSEQSMLLQRSIDLYRGYQVASFELRVGYVGVKSLKPLISVIEHCRQELSVIPKVSLTSADPELIASFRGPGIDLSVALLESMAALEKIVISCYSNSMRKKKPEADCTPVLEVRSKLMVAQKAAGKALESLGTSLIHSSLDGPHGDQTFGLSHDVLDVCLLMITLLQVGRELHHGLGVALEIHQLYHSSRLTIFHPRFSLAWLGASPDLFLAEDKSTSTPFPRYQSDIEVRYQTMPETMQGIAEHSDTVRSVDTEARADAASRSTPPVLSFKRLWNSSASMKQRLRLSNTLRSIQHSPHLRHAINNALGVTLLAMPFFLPSDNQSRMSYEWIRGQWLLITVVYVLEVNVGATWRVGYLRLFGTVTGALYAYIVTLIAKNNPYLIVLFLLLAELGISWIVVKTKIPSFGIVASVTLPPIILAPYVTPDASISTWQLAVLRAAMISAGILAALTLNSILFPRHARVQFLDQACSCLATLNEGYICLTRDLMASDLRGKDKEKIIKLELTVRNILHRMNALLVTMEDELSLVPKPMQKYRSLLGALQKLQDLLTGLRKIRKNIPRLKTVFYLLPIRRELISSVCLTLFACEHSIGARQPLPQFLPSTKNAFMALEHAIEEQIESMDLRDGLGVAYSLAEMDALGEMVDCLTELSSLVRDLFGTANWYTTPYLGTPMCSPVGESFSRPLSANGDADRRERPVPLSRVGSAYMYDDERVRKQG